MFSTAASDQLRLVSSFQVNGPLFGISTDNPKFLAVSGSDRTFFLDYSDISNPSLLGSVSEQSFPFGTGIYRKPFLYWSSRNTLKTYAVLLENELTYSRHSSQLKFYLPPEQRLQSRVALDNASWNDHPAAEVHSFQLDENQKFFRAVRE